jgi:hypothetical protein
MSYIRREDAKNAIFNYICEQTVSKYPSVAECKAAKSGAEGAFNEIDYIPTADVVEVRHGEWLPTNIPTMFSGVIHECSICKAKDGEHSSILGYYCWRCGAKMDGERREG